MVASRGRAVVVVLPAILLLLPLLQLGECVIVQNKQQVQHHNNLQDIVQVILASLNKSVDPCADFYSYSCGGWIRDNPLPPDADAIFKSITTIEDNNQVILRSILETQYNGSLKVDQRLLDFYASCMDTATVEKLGLTPLAPFEGLAESVKTLDDFIHVSALFQLAGFSPLFEFTAVLDSENPNMTIAQLSQGGVYLPDPSLYTDSDILGQYTAHITKMLVYAGATQQEAATMAKSVVSLETQIASVTVPPDQLQDPFVTYNKIDLKGLMQIAPQIPWSTFFSGIGFPNITQINVDAPSFYTNLAKIISATDVATYQAYLMWGGLHTMAPYLPAVFVQEDFAFFGQVLQGLDEQSPRWESCIELVDGEMGMLLGKYFVQVAFPGASKQDASTMIQTIESMMKTNLDTIPWMDNTTRANALLKLSEVSNQIGYPDNFFTYEGLSISPSTLFENVINANQWNFEFVAQLVQKPTNKGLWEMTPATVNAYYDPTKNGMVFPAGILQTPFFDMTFSPPIYYGGSGVIMGHELTHGFDDQGRDFDGQGVLRNWWQPATSQKFDELTSCVINQFSQFQVLPGVYVNGNLTQGENIADMGGTKLAYLALQSFIGEDSMTKASVVPGFTNAQLFFVAYAQGWCSNQTPESLKIQVATNPHSPARFRVLGPLIDHPYFASTFHCPIGSYMNPKDKCSVW